VDKVDGSDRSDMSDRSDGSDMSDKIRPSRLRCPMQALKYPAGTT